MGRLWKYEYTLPISYLGSPVQRNEEVSQYEITVSNLRVRKEPNGEILGYINPGFYNILEEEQRDDYLWIKISANMWVAYSEEFGNLYLKEKNIEDNDDDLEENTEKKKKMILAKKMTKIILLMMIMRMILLLKILFLNDLLLYF